MDDGLEALRAKRLQELQGQQEVYKFVLLGAAAYVQGFQVEIYFYVLAAKVEI